MIVQEELEQRHHLEARPGFGEQPLDVRGLIGLEQPLGAVDKDRGGEDGQQLEVIESEDAIPQKERLMRKAIRGHQRSSESSEVIESEDAIPQQERLMRKAIRGHQRSSESSEVIESEDAIPQEERLMRKAIRGHQRSSESSEVIESEDAIPQQERLLDTTLDGHVRRENPKGRQTHSDALRRTRRQSEAIGRSIRCTCSAGRYVEKPE
jgi:hypothetical protein